MSVPRKPRARKEAKPSNGGTALALLALLAITGGLIALGAMVMPQVFGLPAVVFGFVCFGALHYLLWGWWLKAVPPKEENEEFRGDVTIPTSENRVFEGLQVIDNRDGSNSLIANFGIRPGQEKVAAEELLSLLEAGCEICLRNDLDEGGEGCTIFRLTGSGLLSMVGGHGWQGSWKPIDEAIFRMSVGELAALNRGNHWSNQGSITSPK